MPLTNKEKQQALRDRRKAAGLERAEYWVTKTEHKALDERMAELRKLINKMAMR